MCFEWMPSNTIMKRRNFCTKSNCLLGGGCQWEVQELNFAPSTHRLVWAVRQILPECIKHHSVLKVKLHARHQHTALTWSTCMCQQSVNQTGPMRVWTFSQTAEHHSPSPCTVVMRCPSRKRSTLERYEEGPLSTTTSFSTWNTHTKGIHPRMLPFLSSIYTTWHVVTECTSILVTIVFFFFGESQLCVVHVNIMSCRNPDQTKSWFWEKWMRDLECSNTDQRVKDLIPGFWTFFVGRENEWDDEKRVDE